MKLIAVLMLLACFEASAVSYGQSVSLSKRNISLSQLFDAIEKQTGYTFIISSDLLKESQPVTVNFDNKTLAQALDICFTSLPYRYIITNKTVVISRRPSTNDNSVKLALNKRVTGKVLDDTGSPIIGAIITEKGTNNKVVTDINGNFKIDVSDQTSTLLVSFIGFTTQEVAINGSASLSVTLKNEVKNLADVVITGYGGIQNRRDVTAAISKVNVEDLQKAPVISFDQALAGRVSGVQVVSQDGQPGAPISIVIRGNNSLTQDNSPLYVIDGFPIENPDNNMINPNEIESIEVLKDASATAIYGARGANGVILITTKKGKLGAPVVEFQTFYSQQNVTKRIPLLGPYDYIKYLYELNSEVVRTTYLHNADNNPTSIDSAINTYKNVKGVDFQDAVFGRPAPFTNYNLSVRGGTETTKYNVVGNYADQQGIVVNSGFKRYQLKFNLDQVINTKLNFSLNSTYGLTNQYGISPVGSGNTGLAGGTSYLLAAVWGYRPITSSGDAEALLDNPYDPNDATAGAQIYNPIYSSQNEYHKNLNYNLVINGYLDYKIVKNLKLRVSAGINKTDLTKENFYNSQTRQGRISSTNANGVNGDYATGNVNNITNENTLTYSNVFKRVHHVTILGGVTGQSTTTNSFYQQVTNLPNEGLMLAGFSQGTAGIPQYIPSQNTLLSALGRVQYDYKSNYLFALTYRADGSSKFSAENRWSYFPSGSFAWRISSEPFLKNITIINDAKIRIGYGKTGNNRVGDFATYSSLGSTFTPIGGAFVYANTLANLGNKDLKWETTASTNLGLDLDMFKSRITLVVDLYNKVTSDLLLNANLPPSSGYGTGLKNIGKVGNRGLEITVNTVNVKSKSFTWSSNFNISFNRNKVLALTDNQQYQYGFVNWNGSYNGSPLYIAKLGQPMGLMFGYVSDGIYQYSDFDRSPTGVYTLKSNVPTSFTTRATLPQPGTVKFKDLNGDGVINNDDRTVIGNGNPLHTGGFSNNFTYKNIDLNVFLQWSYGNDIYNANRLIFEGGSPNNSSGTLNQYATYADRWSPTNQTNSLPKANSGVLPGNYYVSRVVEDGSYLRIKTVSLGYRLSKKTVERLNIVRDLRVYVSAQNLWTLTKYSGFDPEVDGRPGALTPGFDYSVYPRARTTTIGINVSF